MDVDYKGLLSFGVGGTIVLMVFWNLMANTQLLQYGYDFGYVSSFILQNGVLSFIGFLLIGIGLMLIIKKAKAET
jgi:hypothetical protein